MIRDTRRPTIKNNPICTRSKAFYIILLIDGVQANVSLLTLLNDVIVWMWAFFSPLHVVFV